jgi:hypothetical protein
MTAALILILGVACPQQSGDTKDDDDTWDVFTVIFESVFGYPFRDHDLRFDDFPYAHGEKYFLGRRPADEDKFHAMHERKVAFEAGFEYGRMKTDRTSLALRGAARFASGCDLSIDVSRFLEDADDGTERLTLQQYHLNIGRRGTEGGRSYQISAGLGLGILEGEGVSDVGFSLRGALVLYPEAPFSARLSATISFFEDATLNDFRAEIGLHLDRFALLGGVRSLISSEEGNDLTGPTIGAVVFF